MNRNSAQKDEIRYKCIELKLTDVEAARYCNISEDCFKQWRHRKGYGPCGTTVKRKGHYTTRNYLPLTSDDERMITRMKDGGYSHLAIATRIEKSYKKVCEFVQEKYNKIRIEKPKIEVRYSEDNFEPLPTYSTPCKVIAIDKYLAEQDLKRWGNKVQPIKMPLSERGKALNLGGIVIGASFYSNRLGVN